MWLKRKWSLLFDLRNLGILFPVFLISCLVTLIFTLYSKDIFAVQFIEPHLIKSNHYFIFDFILPVMMMFSVLILFSEDLKGNNFAFICSMPVSKWRLLAVRYIRLLFSFSAPYLFTLYLLHLKINEIIEEELNFWYYVMISFPTCLFVMGIALFFIVLTRRLFYSAVICGGYILLDAASMGNFLGNKSLFISMYIQNFSLEHINTNRIIFFTTGLILPILSYFIFNTKLYNRFALR